jgi:hypothetical protein
MDPEAEFIFVPAADVASIQVEQGAIGFDAPNATYPHKNPKGLCSFAALVQERFSDDPVLVELARIVQAADFKDRLDDHPAARGLQAISHGFPLVAKDDHETVERAGFLYDSLYATIRENEAPQSLTSNGQERRG